MSARVRACIGLGANLGDACATLDAAFEALAALPQARLLARSRMYRTPAWGGVPQPDFINAAALLDTGLPAPDLLSALLDIEHSAGRRRDPGLRWGPRVLDLDLLLYGDEVVDLPGLRVPHPHLHERAFALVPLAEVAADAPFPGFGSVVDALRGIDTAGVEPMHAAADGSGIAR